MRSFSFLLTALIFTANVSVCYAAEKADLSIESDLVEILDSFDSKKGYNPHHTPKLSDILEAKGTLVFFDNTNSTGQKPTIGGNIQTKPSNMLQKILGKARQRLFGASQVSDETESNAAVFSDRRRVNAADWLEEDFSAQQQLRFLKLDYNGPKTMAAIPPNTMIEVPFFKHIPYFFSRIEILGNGSLKVTETIERVVEQNETDFKGIDRYFSKYYTDRTGKTHRTNLTVLEASVDNIPIQPLLLPDVKGIRLALHSKAQTPGTHLYRITYLFSNKITELKNSSEEADAPDFKELIWEVTGRNWDIPITRAGAVMIFPSGSKLYSQAAVTGGKNGYGDNYKIKKDKGNDLSFVLTFPLAPYEGFAVLANWSEPNSAPVFENGKLDRFIIEHGTAVVSFIAFLFVLSYYLATWFSLRKNQVKPQVKAAPLQKGDLTPAVLNYALKKEITPNSLLMILLGMASKGFLSFGEDTNGTLLLIKETDKESGLTSLEKKIAGELFTKDNTSFALTNANSLRLARIMAKIEKHLTKEYRKKFTVFPQAYFWFGILMAVIAIAALSSMSLFPLITAVTSFASVFILIPSAFIGGKIYNEIRRKAWKQSKARLLKLSLAALPLLVCLIGLFIYYSIQTTVLTAVFFFALLICIGVFKTLLRTPSSLGSSILENIEGYKLYLSSQDDTLLNMMRNAESKIKALYNKHLPFAVALELDRSWTRRFAAFSEKENQLKPDWYKGKLPFTESFVETLTSEFNKAFPQKPAAKKGGASSRFKKPNAK
ncbi:MAG: DUF2207 domain-containing protein [Alphaproteobacteria bacterium]|nr:DUF2207 domain-containing protein [Alphaproteobacteria bacterium]